jgi:hypothetical protein
MTERVDVGAAITATAASAAPPFQADVATSTEVLTKHGGREMAPLLPLLLLLLLLLLMFILLLLVSPLLLLLLCACVCVFVRERKREIVRGGERNESDVEPVHFSGSNRRNAPWSCIVYPRLPSEKT